MTDYAGLVERLRQRERDGLFNGVTVNTPDTVSADAATAIEELQRELALSEARWDEVGLGESLQRAEKAEAQLARQQAVIEAARVQHEAYGAYHGLKAALSALDPGSETT